MTELAHGAAAHDERIIGWKAIAAHLEISPRTAVRWSETYALPVHRIARGNRPFVFALRAELDAWSGSADAAHAMREEGGHRAPSRDTSPSPECEVNVVAGAQDPSPISTTDGDDWRPRRRSSRAWRLAIAGAVVLVGGAIAAWRLPGTTADRTLAWKIAKGAHGEALSRDQVRLEVAMATQKPSTIVTRPGDMCRVETASVRLGLQTRHEGDRLRLIVHRLDTLAQGESATYLLTRDLTNGRTERLRVEGHELDVTWVSSAAALDAAEALAPVQPCCVVCPEATMCGRAVVSGCGHCEGKPTAGN